MFLLRRNCFRKNVENDHFPIPARHGGKQTVIACKTCHDMKDRHTLENWPQEWIDLSVSEMAWWSRETKLLFTKKHAHFDHPMERWARRYAGQPITRPKNQWRDGPNDRWPWW